MSRFASPFLLALLALPGCSLWLRPEAVNYRTVAVNPNRDSERAKAENQAAVKLMDDGKWEKAEQALHQALIADITFGPAHNNLGRLYFCQGKLYLAAWEFEYAIKVMPERAEPYNNLGLVYESAGKLEEAIEWYTAALGHDPENPHFIGNLARARMRDGGHDPEVQQLLGELVLYDTRPDWVCWAREHIALAPRSAIAPPAAAPAIETLPAPRENRLQFPPPEGFGDVEPNGAPSIPP